MKNTIKLLNILFILVLITSCEKSEGTVDYSWTKQAISVKVDNFATDRVSETKSLVAETGTINEPAQMTATCIDFLNDNLAVVSYHATNGNSAGRIELISCNDGLLNKVEAVMEFPESRVNNIITDQNNRVFAAIDHKNGPVVAMVQIENNKFVETETLNSIKICGESANGLALSNENGSTYIYTSSASDGTTNIGEEEDETVFSFDGKSEVKQSAFLTRGGFQKTRVDGNILTPIFSQGNKDLRGKWIATNNGSVLTLHMSKYSNTQTGYNAIFYMQFFKDAPKSNFYSKTASGSNSTLQFVKDYQGKNQCLLTNGSNANEKIAYICAADKGLQSFKIDYSEPKGTITHISTTDKYAISADIDENYVYQAAGELGVRVFTHQNGVMSPYKVFKIKDSEKAPSANFVKVRNNTVYIAYGTQGLMSINKDSNLFE